MASCLSASVRGLKRIVSQGAPRVMRSRSALVAILAPVGSMIVQPWSTACCISSGVDSSMAAATQSHREAPLPLLKISATLTKSTVSGGSMGTPGIDPSLSAMLHLLAQSRNEAVFDKINEMTCAMIAARFRTVSVPAFRLWLKKQWQHARAPRLQAPDLRRWARNRRFDVIVADPPWPNCTNWTLSEHAFYPRMRVTEICALPVADLAAERSLLFLWCTSMFLLDAIRALQSWGFRFCGYAFIWVKRTKNGKPAHGFGPTYYTAKCTELVIMGSKGAAPIAQQHVVDLLDTQRREHSRKPDEFWHSLHRYLGDTYPRRVELFAREKRKGWATWGNEVKQF